MISLPLPPPLLPSPPLPQDAEDNLEVEEKKVLSIQLEFGKYKQDVERRMAEKDEEIEAARKNLQRQLEALQSNLEEEVRTRNNLNRQRKAAEDQLSEMEGQLSGKEKEVQDHSKNIKKLQAQLKVRPTLSFPPHPFLPSPTPFPPFHLCTQ